MRISSLILFTLAFAHPSTAKALTRTEHVTSQYLLAHPGFISVNVVEKEEGMFSFTVKFKHEKSRYVVAHMKVRDDLRMLSESHTPMFTRTEESTYYFSIPREFVRTSTYSLSLSHVQEHIEKEPFPWSRHYKTSSKFREELSEPIPVVGSIVYEICLSDFVSPNVPNDSCNNELALPLGLE